MLEVNMSEMNFGENLSPEEEMEQLAKMDLEAVDGDQPQSNKEEPVALQAIDPATKEDAVQQLLQNLYLERLKLQQQLSEIATSSLADKRRIEQLENALKNNLEQTKEVEQKGPSPEQVAAMMEQRIAELENQLVQAEANNADSKTLAQMRKSLRDLERQYNQYIIANTIAQVAPDPQKVIDYAANEALTRQRFEMVKQQFMREYPILDPNSEFFNPQVRDQVHKFYNPLIAQGINPVDALIEATTTVLRSYNIKPVSELLEELRKEKMSRNLLTNTDVRKAEQLKKNIAAAQSSPPDLTSVGRSSDAAGIISKYDFSKMSLREFEKIPQSELEEIERALMMYNE